MPSKRVTLSNVPPFVKDDFLVNMLSRYGKNWFHQLRKHHLEICSTSETCGLLRRYAYMVLKDNAELDVSFNFRMDDFDYKLYAKLIK